MLRRPPAAFLLNGAITRGATGTKTFLGTCLTYMQSFIKIGERVLEKTCHMIQTLCNFNKDKKSCVNVISQNSKLGSRNLLDASL